jgi:hypothetical protein
MRFIELLPKSRRCFSPSVDELLCPALHTTRTWALWGNREVIASVDGYLDADGYVRVYSVDKNRAIAHAADDRMRNFLVMLAVSEFLGVMEARYAELRDSARAQHRSFTAKGVRLLRKSFLTLSLDLTSVFRDVDSFWQRTWRDRGDTQFVLNHAPWIVAADKAAGRKPFMPIDMVTKMRKVHRDKFKQAVAAHHEYRDILSTVASLGASVDTFRLGRLALWVAIASLGIALMMLLVTEIGDDTALGK